MPPFLLALILLPLTAFADECAQLPPPTVTVKRLDAPASLRRDYGVRQLDSLGAERNRPGHHILGLTRGKAVVRYETRLAGLADRARRWECSSPQITLHYGFDPLVVYVANEFSPGSCAYDEIYAHEQRHVETYRRHAAALEAEIAATLKQRFETGDPWRGPVGQTQQRLAQEMESRWLPYVTRLLNQAELAQAQIDTAEEYERTAASCNGEIRRRLAGMR